MIGHEAGDKVVGMIVARLHSDRRGDAGFIAGFGKQQGLKLLSQKGIGVALIDQQFGQARAILDEGASVVFAPCRTVGAEIAGQCLFAPRAVQRADNRSEGADRPKPAGVSQRDGQRAVPAH